MKYLHAYSAPFRVTDRGRFERLAGELGIPFEENLVDGSYCFDVSGERMDLFEGIESLGPFLNQMTELVAIDFRLTVCRLDTDQEKPFDVVFYRIWAGKVWTVWLDALEWGFCGQAIDPELWNDLADLELT